MWYLIWGAGFSIKNATWTGFATSSKKMAGITLEKVIFSQFAKNFVSLGPISP
jgi:hypothetical protein